MSKGIKKTTGIRRIFTISKWERKRIDKYLRKVNKKPWPRAMQSEGEGAVVGNAGRQD